MTHDSHNSTAATTPPPAVWQWLVLSLILIGAMSFLTAHAPPAWQRPGPTALWLAIVSGVLVGGIAVVNRIDNRRLVFSAAFVLIVLAIAGMTLERHRLYVNSLAELYLGAPKPAGPGVLGEQMRPGAAAEGLIESFRADHEKIYHAKRPFAVFLSFRLKPLGITESPWPWVFWIGEILLGSLAGAFAAAFWHSWQTEPSKSAP